MILTKEQLQQNLDQVIWDIEEARVRVSEHHIVKLVTVAKYTEVENIESLYRLGQRAFGENQVQQLQSRIQQLDALPLEWHMIGSLQKNKINKLIELQPSLFHGLNSLPLAQELNKKLALQEKKLSCLLQINSANNPNQTGIAPDRAFDLYQEIDEQCTNITLKGVMSIGANSEETKAVQKSFETTHAIYQKLQPHGATICSMGMSGDYPLAIACGSNLVRVGSKLFG
jgi:pyridoxal phosphate enzyme (YggS family)